MQSEVLAGKLQAARQEARGNWQLIQDACGRAEQIRADRVAARTDPDRIRYSAYARLQERLASMPVIEQAKGILMAQYGWPEDQAFDALRRASQRDNSRCGIWPPCSSPGRRARHLPSRAQAQYRPPCDRVAKSPRGQVPAVPRVVTAHRRSCRRPADLRTGTRPLRPHPHHRRPLGLAIMGG